MLLCATAMDRRAASTMWAETERIYPRRAHGKQVSGHPAMAMVAGLSSGRLPLLLQIRRPLFRRNHAAPACPSLGARAETASCSNAVYGQPNESRPVHWTDFGQVSWLG